MIPHTLSERWLVITSDVVAQVCDRREDAIRLAENIIRQQLASSPLGGTYGSVEVAAVVRRWEDPGSAPVQG